MCRISKEITALLQCYARSNSITRKGRIDDAKLNSVELFCSVGGIH